jgi:hypothetical protein
VVVGRQRKKYEAGTKTKLRAAMRHILPAVVGPSDSWTVPSCTFPSLNFFLAFFILCSYDSGASMKGEGSSPTDLVVVLSG